MYEVFTRNHRHDLLREYEIQDLPEQYNYGTTLGYRRDTVTVLRDKQREDFLATQMGGLDTQRHTHTYTHTGRVPCLYALRGRLTHTHAHIRTRARAT